MRQPPSRSRRPHAARHLARGAALLVGSAVATAAFAASGVLPAGGEIRVNEPSPGYPQNPAIGANRAGDGVAVWHRLGFDASDNSTAPTPASVRARRLDPTGLPVGDEIEVRSLRTSRRAYPDVAVAEDGSFHVAWEEPDTTTSVDADVWLRSYDASGAPFGPAVRAHAARAGDQDRAGIAVTPSGGGLVVWGDDPRTLDPESIRGRAITRDGQPVGAELVLSPAERQQVYFQRVTPGADDELLVTWQSWWPDPTDNATTVYAVEGRLLDETGAARTEVFRISETPRPDDADAVLAGDRYLVSWEDSEPTVGPATYVRELSLAGVPLGPSSRVTPGWVDRPLRIAARASGDFMLAHPVSYATVALRFFDASGESLGEVLGLGDPIGLEFEPSVVATDDDYLVAYQAVSRDERDDGIGVRRFVLCEGPDADQDGVADRCDNCPDVPNPDQSDLDDDFVGDACDPCTDADGDGVCDLGLEGPCTGGETEGCNDNCPEHPNPDQLDGDADGVGSACDNCPDAANPGQENSDGDSLGDVCDDFTPWCNPSGGAIEGTWLRLSPAPTEGGRVEVRHRGEDAVIVHPDARVPWPVAWISEGTFRAVHPEGRVYTGRVDGATVDVTVSEECSVVEQQLWELQSAATGRGTCIDCDPVCPAGGDAIEGTWVPDADTPDPGLGEQAPSFEVTNHGEWIRIDTANGFVLRAAWLDEERFRGTTLPGFGFRGHLEDENTVVLQLSLFCEDLGTYRYVRAR